MCNIYILYVSFRIPLQTLEVIVLVLKSLLNEDQYK